MGTNQENIKDILFFCYEGWTEFEAKIHDSRECKLVKCAIIK